MRNSSKFLFLVSGVFASLFANVDTTLIDDFEGGSHENRLGYNWYYYDLAHNGDSKVILNIVEPIQLMEPAAGIDRNGGYAAELSWDMGDTESVDNVRLSSQMVGLGTSICVNETGVDISSAKQLTFWVKAKKAMKLYVEIGSADVSEADEPFAFLYQKISQSIQCGHKSS